MPTSLKSFILAVTILVSLVFFSVTYFIFSNIYTDSITKNAHQVSANLAQYTFNSMFQVMSKGWSRSELEAFISNIKKSVENTPIDIDIYRGKKVTQLFGPIEQGKMDAQIRMAFREGKEQRQTSDSKTRYIFPLKAEQKCLRCHLNAENGNVLGVIDVKQDLSPFIDEASHRFLFSLSVIAPIPFLIIFVIVLFINRKIGSSISELGRNVENITRVSDLKYLELEELNLGFTELNDIVDKVGKLSGKMKSIAVDKTLLEMEIRLLEKFVITSDVIRDWHDYVNLMLKNINDVVSTYMLFSIFKVDEGVFDVKIFWHSEPSGKTRELVEKMAGNLLMENLQYSDESAVNFSHHISDSSRSLKELSERDIEQQSKSLLVETPKIGGIVGIGVQVDMDSGDETPLQVMEGILSTLLNVVGSIKAIHKYTCELEFYANRDPLTELYNQRMFWELLGYEINRSARHKHKFSLLVIDLDNFKSINDTYGHSFGDTFLQKLTNILKEALRIEDILTRYGGDEFVAILPETTVDEAANCARRVLDAICSMNVIAADGTPVRGSASVGIVSYPEHATEKKNLFMLADNMMYKAKSEGKNRICIPTKEDVVEALRLISETSIIVTNAVENRNLFPFFQPLVNTETRKIEAVEVLSRIRKEDGTILEARKFIEIAEKIGIIHKMDYIVMEKALQAVQEQNFHGDVFFNLSPRALVLNEFIPEVCRIVSESGIDPGRIIFEITERETVKNINTLEEFIGSLRKEGFRLAIDDFGSGFSSFHYLRRFPVDFIKIEGDFVTNITNSDKDITFVRSISLLAQELGIMIVAECVENEEVLQTLCDIGIDLVQGYHLGKPSETLPSS